MPRLDDHIRDLCEQVSDAPEEQAVPIAKELRSAIHKKAQRIRQLAAKQLVQKKSAKELRKAG
jgi:hypothetical protein